MNTTSHRVYQTGEGERGSEVAANDLGRLRIRLPWHEIALPIENHQAKVAIDVKHVWAYFETKQESSGKKIK